jgi:hypothetical protein
MDVRLLCLCCEGSGLCDDLITGTKRYNRLWVSSCVWFRNLKKWGVLDPIGLLHRQKKKISAHIYCESASRSWNLSDYIICSANYLLTGWTCSTHGNVNWYCRPLGRRRLSLEGNGCSSFTELAQVVESCEDGKDVSGFVNPCKTSWLAEWLLSPERLCSLHLVS